MRKRKYLYRLAVSMFAVLLLPMSVFIICFGMYSYEKVEKTTEVYFEELMDFYMVQVDQLHDEMQKHTATIIAGSKKKDSIFWEKRPEDNYWYYQMIQELKSNYKLYSPTDFGIYYFEEDCIIAPAGKMSPTNYFANQGIENWKEETYLLPVFTSASYEEAATCIGGTMNQDDGNNIMLIGFRADLGRQRDKALVFYEFTESDMESFFESAYIVNGLECYLRDKRSGFSFCWGNLDEGRETEMFKEKESEIHSLVLVSRMNEHSIQGMTLTFLNRIMYLISAAIVICVLGSLLTLYIAYKPVFHLTTRLKHSSGNEFETIRRALDVKDHKIEEQEIQLMDMMLNNLLYKVPVSKNKLAKLDIETCSNYYTVFLLNHYVLTEVEAKKMIEETETVFSVKMFVTDLEEEHKSIFTLLLEEEETKELKEYLRGMCRELGIAQNSLVGGMVVSDIGEIWRCLEFCEAELRKKTFSNESSNRDLKKAMLREDILAYVDIHYRDSGLCQIQVANHFDIAVCTLSRIFKNDIGMGFVAYVNAKRIEYAKELLLTTNDSVHSIALQSGFDNDNNFFKVFKASTGISPSTFRVS